MPDLKYIEGLLEEIGYLRKSHEFLEEVAYYLSPYDYQINGKNSQDLCRKIYEHLHGFDDSE